MSIPSSFNKQEMLSLFINKYGKKMCQKLLSKSTPMIDNMKHKLISTMNNNLNYEIIDEIENMYILYKIPGVEKKDISVLLSKGKLIIKAVCNIDFHTFNIKYNDIIEVPNDTVNTDLTVSFFMGLLKIKINKIKKSNYIEII
jgi:HSP20 family molecular chaperone IbpA